MSKKESCLSGAAAGVRVGKVIAATDEAGGGGASVVAREGGVDIARALGCLHTRLDQLNYQIYGRTRTLMMTKRAPLL